ncbi:MAG: hypothetical protein AAFX05_00115 [Planctomycetota bacterium]
MTNRHLISAATLTAAALCSTADAAILRTFDLGPLGPIGSPSLNQQDILPPTVGIAGEAVDRVEVQFAEGHALRVTQANAGSTSVGPGVFENFGGNPAGGNWVADITWGILDADGNTIASETRLDKTISSASMSFGFMSVPADVPSGTEVYGLFFEFENADFAVFPGHPRVGVGFVGALEIVPAPGAAALLGLAGLCAIRRQRR